MVQSTVRLGRYPWNTSKEGSIRRKTKKKKKKVEEIQLANLVSLGSLASKNRKQSIKLSCLTTIMTQNDLQI